MAGTLTKKFKKLWPGDDKEKSSRASSTLQVGNPTVVKHNPLPPEMLKIIMNAKEQNDEEAKKQLENVYEYFHEQQNKQNTGKADFMKYQHKSGNIRGTSSEDSLDEGKYLQVNFCQKPFFLRNLGKTCSAKRRASDKDLPVRVSRVAFLYERPFLSLPQRLGKFQSPTS